MKIQNAFSVRLILALGAFLLYVRTNILNKTYEIKNYINKFLNKIFINLNIFTKNQGLLTIYENILDFIALSYYNVKVRVTKKEE